MSRFALTCLAATGVVVSLATALPLHGQNIPTRPQIFGDTNSASAYYDYGINVILKQPQTAADAFYWASQLNPTWAQPLYARRIALLLAAEDPFIIGYMEGRRGVTRSKQAILIDSLELRARMLDPFLFRELDVDLLRRYIKAEFDAMQVGSGGLDATTSVEFNFYLERYWRNEAPPYMRAILAASQRRFPEALSLYSQALQRDRKFSAEIHHARGQIFYFLENNDSALVELRLGLDRLRGSDAKDFVYLYESKAVLEQSVGMVLERQGLGTEAREAYGRALQEDLSYYPAHVRLGLLAVAMGDTVAAVSELDLAVQINDHDPWVETTYGAVLIELGRLEDAATHLRRAAELAPYYAAPHYALGRAAQMASKPADAVRHYQAYLARTAAADPRVADVRARLTTLQAGASPRQ
jgi:tetratricopeptide (TPR) repeat protein